MRDRAALLATLVVALVWGYNWVVIKVATADASPLVLVGIRQSLGALALFAILIVLRRPLHSPAISWTAAIGFFQVTLMTGLQTIALAANGAGKTTVLFYTFPFFIVLLSAGVLHERLSRVRVLAVLVAAVGLGFVLYPIDLVNGFVGDCISIAGALCWAIGSLIAAHFRSRTNVDLLTLTTWQMLYGAIPLALLALLVPGGYVHPTTTFVVAMIYMVLLGTALAFSLWMFMLERLTPSSAGIASLLAPVVGVTASALQLHEHPSPTELTGMLLIVVALLINSLPPVTPKKRSSRALHPRDAGAGAVQVGP